MKGKLAATVAAAVFAVTTVLGGGPATAGGDADSEGFTPQIIGGVNATEKYGFHASLQYKDQGNRPSPHRCGGSLIDPQWVLTSAHCVASLVGGPVLDPADFQIVIGANDYQDGTVIDVAEFHRYPGWFTLTEEGDLFLGGDLGLIKLAEPSTEEPIRRAIHPSGPDPVSVRILGWGQTVKDDPASAPTHMQELDSELLGFRDCLWGNVYDHTPGEVCIGTPGVETSACAGDDGSPAIARDRNGEWFLFGVASRSIDGYFDECGTAPDVYTHVASTEEDDLIEWIEGTIAR